jgi:hypothetical protein
MEKNSVNLKKSRYVNGGLTEVNQLSLEWWERIFFESDDTDLTYAVENAVAGRLDLIANAFYDEPRLWWVIAQYNNILDISEEIVPGRILQIPSKERVMTTFLNGQLGGINSQREPLQIIKPVIL